MPPACTSAPMTTCTCCHGHNQYTSSSNNVLADLQVLNLIAHRNDSAAVIPPRELKKLVYGPDSVYARGPTTAQVANMTNTDVVAFLQKWERPDNAVFGMAGVWARLLPAYIASCFRLQLAWQSIVCLSVSP